MTAAVTRRWYRLSADRKYFYAVGADPIPCDPVPPPPPALSGSLTRLRGVGIYSPTSGRGDLVIGTYKPDDTTTGYYAGTLTSEIGATASTTYSAINSPASPQIVQNIKFTNRLIVTGQYITFKNCWMRGWPLTTNDVITCTGANVKGIVFEDCTIAPQSPGWASNGIRGWQFTLRRCRILNTADAIAHQGADPNADQGILVEGCYVSDFAYNSPCPDAAGGITDNAQHTDFFQYRGGTGITFRGNNIQAFIDPTVGQGGDLLPIELTVGGVVQHVGGNKYKTLSYAALPITSVLMCTPILGTVFGGITFDSNWLDGGSVLFNFAAAAAGKNVTDPIIIKDNKFGRLMRLGADFTILAKTSQPLTIVGNTYEDDGSPANQRKAG